MENTQIFTFLQSFGPVLIIATCVYLLVLRPQQQKMKAHQELLKHLKPGDKVITSGGIMGTVTKTTDSDNVILEISKGVFVTFRRNTILEVLERSPLSPLSPEVNPNLPLPSAQPSQEQESHLPSVEEMKEEVHSLQENIQQKVHQATEVVAGQAQRLKEKASKALNEARGNKESRKPNEGGKIIKKSPPKNPPSKKTSL